MFSIKYKFNIKNIFCFIDLGFVSVLKLVYYTTDFKIYIKKLRLSEWGFTVFRNTQKYYTQNMQTLFDTTENIQTLTLT